MHLIKQAAIAAAFSLTATSALAQEVTLRFQHFVSPASANPTYFMQPWADAIEEQSNGRIKVELYPFMQLGGAAPSQYDLIRDGAIDGGWVIPGYQPNRFPEAEAMELPFMTTKSGEEASAAAWDFTQQFLMDDFADVHLIAAHMHGPGIVHKRGEPVQTVEDFAGLKLRGPSRPATLLLQELGATPIGMPVPQFPEALSKGVVDGGVITWEMSPSLKLNELTDSHTDVAGDRALYNLYFIWAMNKDVYESLPADLKAVIDANSGMMASRWAGHAHDTGDVGGRALMAADGNEIAQLSEAETARIKALGETVTANWIAEMDAKGFDGAALVAAARKAVEAHAGQVN
ncbi:TRAP-type C4-dicarboxylate transport system substrate-binding protein [Yoonia sediminilitoris]|uniref:TRAP-type C4-dicarboxylate transport system substrate-binding protein n=2 Tax=Yoonia sediminilitoris TaxID=1286148 RepID=A0A2T6KIK4_9RHOB|nr:TRAP transporter substrate-binding protein [Yoonia sediminilitoris]PUB15547.1 TRAP-type C4-dicarboxylate transport system substrate-binding protein [Yoonia sediminilitoris]RCW96156.1 TRAP-type C4-dicarboxylate transport system substrate-binding protein [Yoonia sediminilitoris]